jgi:hypothetical protein
MSLFVREPKHTAVHNESNWTVVLTVWATFIAYGALAAPVPGVNEPHYLCKSKHFWQPDWCENDFFLASPNAHVVFYATIGSLTQWFSFPQAAWIGRLLSNLLLAWGWTRCSSQLLFGRWSPLWSAWLFLSISACGNFSGEWLVGGVEGKVPSYAFLLASLADALRGRQVWAATWAGLAISFHPVVGIWGVLAYAISQVIKTVWDAHQRKQLRTRNAVTRAWSDDRENGQETDFPKMRTSWVAAYLCPSVVLVLLSLPGLIPVVRLLTEPVSQDVRYSATYLQVFFRLNHHLDPMLFHRSAYFGYGVMILIWLLSFQWGGRTNSRKRFDQIVLWSVVFAVCGIVIGWGPRPPQLMPWFAQRMQLLKFYPFRVADLLVPAALTVSLISVLERTLFTSGSKLQWRSWLIRPEWLLFALFSAGLIRVHLLAESNRYSREDRADWQDVCAWIDQHLPADALVLAPTNCWTLKWYAHRAEYVSFKDCPQDAAGIVEWNRRLNFLQKWFETNYADEFYSAEELKELRRLTGISHLTTDRLGPLELEPLYRNETFQVYDLSSLK